jgi:hypothetical protein
MTAVLGQALTERRAAALDVARLRGHRGEPAALAALHAATVRVERLLRRLELLVPPEQQPD